MQSSTFRFSAISSLILACGGAALLLACGHHEPSRTAETSAIAPSSAGFSGERSGGGGGGKAKRASPGAASAAAPAAADRAEEASGWDDRDAEWEAPPPPEQFPQAGLLTAGVWDDNLNLDTFLNYRASLAAKQLPGTMSIPEKAHLKVRFPEHRAPKRTIDIAFVIDATGSMSDEMQYLQSEFLTLSRQIEERFEGSHQRWALVVYRDEGDEYVVRDFDFEDRPQAFRRHLAAQAAGGGGDYPEATHAGLDAALEKQWRRDPSTARLLYWVADAPHHEEATRDMERALFSAHKKDVHIYPVASSGVDELTELTMRSAAQLTGGRYIFLTDDSGIGNSHMEPTIPCYHVTSLRDAILRTVEMELYGSFRGPRSNEVIRTTGSPRGGRCDNYGQAAPYEEDGYEEGWEAYGR